MVLDKRSVVKHRTRAPASKSKRGGFSVGATNAPSGAYIGHVKKHKADLIHKAKVKKAYYKMREREAPENSNGHENTQDLGRFAPQNEPDDEAVPSTPRHEPSVSRDKPKKLPYFYRPPKAPKNEPAPPKRTREEALEERAVRRDMWNRKSPSRLGRQRGQPDLGARVAVMLEKIQKST